MQSAGRFLNPKNVRQSRIHMQIAGAHVESVMNEMEYWGSGVGWSKKVGVMCVKKNELDALRVQAGNCTHSGPCAKWLSLVSPPQNIFDRPELKEVT
jgi:hypothetical protein